MAEKLHYVYLLLDPLDNQPFYVGKGTGRRAEAHLRENSETNKAARIQSITNRSDSCFNQVLVRIIGRFTTEKEALAVEATLIKWVYGFHTLTNLVHGHGSSSIRSKGDLSELPGIDIEKQVREYPMEFTSNAIKDNEAHGIELVLSQIKESIECYLPHLNVSEVDMNRPKDPSVYVLFDPLIRIQLLVRPRKNGAVPNAIFNIRPMDRRKQTCERFEQRALELGYPIKGNKTDRYFKIPIFPKANTDNHQEILDSIDGIIKALEIME